MKNSFENIEKSLNVETSIISSETTEIEKIKLDKIYCSPFIRTLQTIYPYSKEVRLSRKK